MKVIANIITITLKDLKLTDKEILSQLSKVQPGTFSTILAPEAYGFMVRVWEIQRLIRPYCKSHITCLSYTGKATFKNLNK